MFLMTPNPLCPYLSRFDAMDRCCTPNDISLRKNNEWVKKLTQTRRISNSGLVDFIHGEILRSGEQCFRGMIGVVQISETKANETVCVWVPVIENDDDAKVWHDVGSQTIVQSFSSLPDFDQSDISPWSFLSPIAIRQLLHRQQESQVTVVGDKITLHWANRRARNGATINGLFLPKRASRSVREQVEHSAKS
jgi:hypothetical protein